MGSSAMLPAAICTLTFFSLLFTNTSFAKPVPPAHVASPHVALVKRAPSGAPLTPFEATPAEEVAGVASSEGDQLVENGLASPLCSTAVEQLTPAARDNCETSHFVAAPAPTNNYAFDVNIDVGTFGLSKGGLLSVIQDVFIAPIWGAIVWCVHALLVVLEWCYSLELLSGAGSSLTQALHQAQVSFTRPWLALVLVAASMLALYEGLVRRRVADTLSQALLTVAMMAAGLWVIADPLGTVGAIGQWANQASLGTLGAAAAGTPTDADRTLGESMRALFQATVETPWCYLEFGDVDWCESPALLDPSLHKAAQRLAAERLVKLKCTPTLKHGSCGSNKDAEALAAERSATLVDEANSNGQLFLAFPANKPERNSVKQSGSLLKILCRRSEDTKCTGPTASQAEFRSDVGTFPRLIGVLLIAAGVLGMVLLFGLLAARLLVAALGSLFLLLLAPFAVLAPALGERGRTLFTGWLTRLLGSVTSKLLYSFLFGAVITAQRLLIGLQTLGWWTQWLIVSVFWWTIFLKRDQAFAIMHNGGSRHVSSARHRPLVSGAFRRSGQTLGRVARWSKHRVLTPAPSRMPPSRKFSSSRVRPPMRWSVPHDEHPDLSGSSAGAFGSAAFISAKQAQLERVRDARNRAFVAGDRRRALTLDARERRIEDALTRELRTSPVGSSTSRWYRLVERAHHLARHTRSLGVEHERAAAHTSLRHPVTSSSRSRVLRRGRESWDQASSAPAGYGILRKASHSRAAREQHARLAPYDIRHARQQQHAQLAPHGARPWVDRDPTRRSTLYSPTSRPKLAGSASPSAGARRDPQLEDELARRAHPDHYRHSHRANRGQGPAARVSRTRLDTRNRSLPGRALGPSNDDPPVKSKVMDDARAVAEGRKRQLGPFT